MRYAAVATTSRFYRDHVFESSFLARHFPIIGYPRNDFALSLHGKFHELAWSNVDADIRGRLEAWQRSGRRVVLVTPTFRGSGAAPMQLDFAILRAIDEFADTNGTEFIFKFHPSERNADHIGGRHFHVCSRESDIYPVLPHAAALVTDFSSISMDFLLVDKPILFLVPEGDDYVEKDRQLQFDPHTMMPGPLLPDWPSLLTALLAEWTCDGYLEERAALRRKAFDAHPQSEAVPKLIAFMREQGWVSPAVNKDNLRPRISQPPTNPR
jgi:CDP-glycerol glycerophosphotransferase (TagB/SpsB family)